MMMKMIRANWVDLAQGCGVVAGIFLAIQPDHGGGALLGPSRQQRHHLRDRSARGGGADDPGRYRHLSGHHL